MYSVQLYEQKLFFEILYYYFLRFRCLRRCCCVSVSREAPAAMHALDVHIGDVEIRLPIEQARSSCRRCRCSPKTITISDDCFQLRISNSMRAMIGAIGVGDIAFARRRHARHQLYRRLVDDSCNDADADDDDAIDDDVDRADNIESASVIDNRVVVAVVVVVIARSARSELAARQPALLRQARRRRRCDAQRRTRRHASAAL